MATSKPVVRQVDMEALCCTGTRGHGRGARDFLLAAFCWAGRHVGVRPDPHHASPRMFTGQRPFSRSATEFTVYRLGLERFSGSRSSQKRAQVPPEALAPER